MKLISLGVLCAFASQAVGADALKSTTTHGEKYGPPKNAVSVDAAKDLPRYPAVEPKDAIATWQVKHGFRLELAAQEPQVRDPIAICFDQRGRMFVCEMIDYSEMRDASPHLGRISMLEDKDGDGTFETSSVFADDLPWPTGLIFANGGLYVGATPDIWFFKDGDGDGRAEVREKVFTGFGTGLKLLNVQGLLNSFQWGQDNRIHVLAGGGNRGLITCPKRPERPAQELGGQDFWFDPRTLEFGLEAGGAQYGMSFDNYGRKFGCSNSDHLQTWLYDGKYAVRNPAAPMPPARASIAADGGAAEVFRISPDEPWRIIRTRWRIAGVVRGSVEGGGRVSGYFTGATGTTIYRGDAYGSDFVNNSFTGDAGGQLVHRKIIRAAEDGIGLVGERPADERGFEFAASKDTWVRVVNFANAPDGCLHVCDMYREVIEHPWSIPDEIKQHLDLNSGNDRGRIYRIVPDPFLKRRGTKVNLAEASPEELVKTLGHANGWHRDTAQRLLYERQDRSAVPLLNQTLEGDNPLAKLHALGALAGMKALDNQVLIRALGDGDRHVRERALALCAQFPEPVVQAMLRLRDDPAPRVRFRLALTLGQLSAEQAAPALAEIARNNPGNPWITAAILSAPPAHLRAVYDRTRSSGLLEKAESAALAGALIRVNAGSTDPNGLRELIAFVSAQPRVDFIRALAEGLQRAGKTIVAADSEQRLGAVFADAAVTAIKSGANESARIEAIELLGFTTSREATAALTQCLAKGQLDAIQTAAIKILARRSSPDITKALLESWTDYRTTAREAALSALIGREDRAAALLDAVSAGRIPAAEFTASQVQNLVQHKSPKIAAQARTALAAVVPPTREEVVAKFRPALTTDGDGTRGQMQYTTRCLVCHRANGQGLAVGPDLVTVKSKGRDALLTAILEPHKEVASQFIAYTVHTRDGQTVTGIIARDDASSMTLRMIGGAEVPLPRTNIASSSSSGQSLMPEGLETGMTVQDMADLLTFIETLQ
jgi:putative membrane-bound dehydrogenase-like protein